MVLQATYGSASSTPTSGTSLRSVESKQNVSRRRTASSKTTSDDDDYDGPGVITGEYFSKVPIGDGLYTFTTSHIPKTDINLCHPYIETVASQMNNEAFVQEWRRYMHFNNRARLGYQVRQQEIRDYDRRKAEEAPKGVAA